jgi:hypothetical protein
MKILDRKRPPHKGASKKKSATPLRVVKPGERAMVAEHPTFCRADHAEIADAVEKTLATQGYVDLVVDEGSLWGSRDPTFLYEKIEPWTISQIIQSYAGCDVLRGAGQKQPLSVTSGLVDGASKLLCARRVSPRFFADAPAGIAFADCFAVVTADGIDEQSHSKDHRARFAYPFALPPAHELPQPLLDYLDDMFGSDGDRAQKYDGLQEHGGGCIAGIAPEYERVVLLVGEADTGKSRLTRFFVAAMPPGTVTFLPLHLFRDQYALSQLVGSRLNVVPDLPADKLPRAVKAIVSGEGQTARDPGSKVFNFIPRGGHIYGCNWPLPPTEDASSGFERRWIIITANRSFTGDPKRDPEIAEKMIAQCTPQMVRWFLEGAVRLKKNKNHTLPDSHHLVMDGWLRREDPVGRFVQTRLDRDVSKTLAATEVHKAFLAWLRSIKQEDASVGIEAFGRQLKKLVPWRKGDHATLYKVRLRPLGGRP